MDALLIIIIGIATVLFCIIALKLHAFLSLLLAALVTGLLTSQTQIYNFALHNGMAEAAAKSLSLQNIGTRLANSFGSTAGKIGVLIALASIIGTALMKSGGAERIVRGLLRLVGKDKTDLALIASSFTLGIPVFFDTVFYLLIPIIKSAGVRNPVKYSLYIMCAAAGATMTHSLVPPTPGPLFVAKELKVDMGIMMLGGIIVGIMVVFCGYIYARWANKKWQLPMRDTPDISIDELRNNTDAKSEDLPNIWLSLAPIVLPIILITGATFLEMHINPKDPSISAGQLGLLNTFKIIGDSNIALLISAIISLYLLWYKDKNIKNFEKNVNESLSSAGMIILITAAGGAFGQMLQQTDIGDAIGNLAKNYQVAILPLAFIITALVRTAQGSATVAMVTAIGVLSGIGSANGFGFHPVYLALVIGCGSKIIPWMNDSAFWVIMKMMGMDAKECIRFFSYLLALMGVAGLFIVMALAYFFPMV